LKRLNHFRPPAAASKAGFGGALRRWAPTWAGVPWRRAAQSLCFALFLVLFFWVSWPYPASFNHESLALRAAQPVELFLWLDPAAGLAATVAARHWQPALLGAAAVLFAAWLLPRCFCGYLCPLGTLIDLFDWAVSRRARQPRPAPSARWAGIRFLLLALVLGAAFGGVMLAGHLAAIPLLTRGLVFTAGNLQLGLLKNWSMLPDFTGAVLAGGALLAVVLLLGLRFPRFWCRYLCPTGALLSLPGLLSPTRRAVDPDLCVKCGQCLEACPFDAINADFSTRQHNCSQCQTCGGACPTEAIGFITGIDLALTPSAGTAPLSRRAALAGLLGGGGLALAGRAVGAPPPPIRPPGSVPEEQFLDLCIRCEQCLKVCPGPVLQAAGFDHGWEALWTPVAVFSHAGCHQDCHFCTQVCPTGAIEPLDMARKRKAKMGLAVIDPELCLPWRGERDCQLCFDECEAAGYHALEMRRRKLPGGEIPEGTFSPEEIEAMTSILAPVVKAEACVGCGLCEYRCLAVNHRQKKLLPATAIAVKT